MQDDAGRESREVPAALSCQLPEGEAGRRRAEVGALFSSALGRRATDDGVELCYPGDDATARALLDFVLFERRCCAQIAYRLSFEPDHSLVRLRLAGPGPLAAAVREWAGIRSQTHSETGVHPAVERISGLIPSSVDAEGVYLEHVEEKHR